MSKDVKTMDVKIKRPKVELSAWLINYSSDVSKGCEQRSMAIIVTSGVKNPQKKLELLGMTEVIVVEGYVINVSLSQTILHVYQRM